MALKFWHFVTIATLSGALASGVIDLARNYDTSPHTPAERCDDHCDIWSGDGADYESGVQGDTCLCVYNIQNDRYCNYDVRRATFRMTDTGLEPLTDVQANP